MFIFAALGVRLTFHEQMAVRDGSAVHVLRATHVITLVVREHLHDHQRALALRDVNLHLPNRTASFLRNRPSLG